MKRTISLLAAALLVLTAVLPVSALTKADGYNAHDVEKIAAFLEQTDAMGVKNGNKLSADYDPEDPSTWGRDPDGSSRFTWTGDVPKRIYTINIYDMMLAGELDVSGCERLADVSAGANNITKLNASGCSGLYSLTADGCMLSELDVSGCTELAYLFVDQNKLTEIDVSDCSDLYQLDVSDNELTDIDVSHAAGLYSLSCVNNALTALDVSGCAGLMYLYAADNQITGVDLSSNTQLYRVTLSRNPIDKLDLSGVRSAEIVYCSGCPLKCVYIPDCADFPVRAAYSSGSGSADFAYSSASNSGTMTAVPDDGASFLGWFTPDGTLVSENAYLSLRWNSPSVLTARFSGPGRIPGDADESGAVDTTDALYVLRCALKLAGAYVDMPHCDMDGSASIDTADALIVLRTALGLM